MVLKRNQTEITPKGFLEKREYNSFMVLDTVNILYHNEQLVFGYSIEILNQIRSIIKVNKMCLGLKSNFNIDTEIYHKVISSVLNNKPFTDDELEAYYKNAQKIEEFLKLSRGLMDIDDNFSVPYEVEYILLGMDMDIYFGLNEEQEGSLSETYGDLNCDVRFKDIPIKDFILKAKEIISNTEKQVLN